MYSLLLNPTFGVVKMIYEKLGIDTTMVINLLVIQNMHSGQ